MVARPRAVPIPRPRIAFGPTRLNLSITASMYARSYGAYANVHGRVLKHVRYDEEADHATADVHLVELGHAPIAASDGDIL
jgi:hypothetical protein